MRTLLQPHDFEFILTRVNSITGTEQRLSGKMSEAQMLFHCHKQIEMALGVIPTKPMCPRPIQWLTKITLGYYIPWPKNLITAPEMVAKSEEKLDFELERLLEVVLAFLEAEKLYPHPIFGNMTKEDWGLIIYKHLDHHLKQFGT